MWAYRLLFAFDALAVLTLGYFFVDGLRYSGPSGPAPIWLPILAVPIAGLLAAWLLREKGRTGFATLILLALAIPPLCFCLFFGVLLATNPNWH